MKASHKGWKWRVQRTDMKIPRRKFPPKNTLQVKMNNKKNSFKLTNDKHRAAISNADLLKIHILVYAPINCICLYVLKSCFTDDHADILTYLNSSQHVDH